MEAEQKIKEQATQLTNTEKQVASLRAQTDSLLSGSSSAEEKSGSLSNELQTLRSKLEQSDRANKAALIRADTAESKQAEAEQKLKEEEKKLKIAEDGLFTTKNKLRDIEIKLEAAENKKVNCEF